MVYGKVEPKKQRFLLSYLKTVVGFLKVRYEKDIY